MINLQKICKTYKFNFCFDVLDKNKYVFYALETTGFALTSVALIC